MAKTDVSILLQILDLEYLKPILTDRFRTLDELASANLTDLGIQNHDDLAKLQYSLVELNQTKHSIEQYEPILSFNNCNQIIERMDNESNLISAGLNSLLNKTSTNLPKHDATCDVDYTLYQSEIDQIKTDVQQLENDAENLLENIEKQYLPSKTSLDNNEKEPNIVCIEAFAILTLSIFCIGLMFYIKHK